jgi:O-methyltransferase
MDNQIILKLAIENPNMSTVDRLVNIYWAVRQVLTFDVPGDLVELGCNAGGTTVFLQMLIDEFAPLRKLHAYDSFEGLPAPCDLDLNEGKPHLREGQCKATVKDFLATFERWNVRPPIMHKGWFSETLSDQLSDRIAFGYLDADFYESTLTCLKCVWPRLSRHGLLLVDDYGDRSRNPHAWEGLPGVKIACDEFFADKHDKPFVLVGESDLSMVGITKSLDRHPHKGK